MTEASFADASAVKDGLRDFVHQMGASGLQNKRTGLGTEKDKARVGHWYFEQMHHDQLECMYRSNWLARKVVDIPVEDMTREGICFEGDSDQCEAFDAELGRLQFDKCFFEALTKSRLYGGAYLYMSDGAEDVSEPFNEANGVAFIKALSCYELRPLSIDLDLSSPNYGEPQSYTSGFSAGASIIHPSRVIRFVGREIPRTFNIDGHYNYEIGDSILETIRFSIEDATSAQQGIANLIQEAKVDVFKVKNFMSKLSKKLHENALLDRFTLIQRMKGIMGAVVIDSDDEYEQKRINFAGLTDIEKMFLQIVAGAADIPVTRLLGQSPSGMNATGESDIRNYYDSIAAMQNRKRPLLDILFSRIAAGMGISMPDYSFNSLWQMDAAQKSEIANRNAQTAQVYANLGFIDPNALADGINSRIIEDGIFPDFDPIKITLPEDIGGGVEE